GAGGAAGAAAAASASGLGPGPPPGAPLRLHIPRRIETNVPPASSTSPRYRQDAGSPKGPIAARLARRRLTPYKARLRQGFREAGAMKKGIHPNYHFVDVVL